MNDSKLRKKKGQKVHVIQQLLSKKQSRKQQHQQQKKRFSKFKKPNKFYFKYFIIHV